MHGLQHTVHSAINSSVVFASRRELPAAAAAETTAAAHLVPRTSDLQISRFAGAIRSLCAALLSRCSAKRGFQSICSVCCKHVFVCIAGGVTQVFHLIPYAVGRSLVSQQVGMDEQGMIGHRSARTHSLSHTHAHTHTHTHTHTVPPMRLKSSQ